MKILYIFWITIIVLIIPTQSLSIESVKRIFDGRRCVEGTLHTLSEAGHKLKVDEVKPISKDMVVNSNNVDGRGFSSASTVHEKSAVSKIEELAAFNDIQYYFELIDEEGPPHDKRFTIKLVLGDESYTAKDRSHKKTKQAVALKALEHTEYNHPPPTSKGNSQKLAPTVLLNNLASKLGFTVEYRLITDTLEDALHSDGSNIIDERPKKSYIKKLNDTIYSNDTIRIRKDESNMQGPFKVKAIVDGKNAFIGKGHTIQNAKHDAAGKALHYVKEQLVNGKYDCLIEGNEEKCKESKNSNRSPISKIYEIAQKHQMPISFEVIDETGPAHKKTFVTECKLGDLTVTGDGRSKKDSKRAAAEKMLESYGFLPELNQGSGFQTTENSKEKNKRKKKNKLVKTNFDKLNMMVDNIVDYGSKALKKMSGSDDNKPKPNPKKYSRPAVDEILELSNYLNFEIQYSDFSEQDKHISLLGIDMKPYFICIGEADSTFRSREKAAKGAINFLYKLGYLDKIDHKLLPEPVEDGLEESPIFLTDVITEE